MGAKPIENRNERKGKYDFIQFSVSEELKKKIVEYQKDSKSKTVSDFIRNLIENEFRRRENPEIEIQNITKRDILRKEIENLEHERKLLISEMNKTLDLIKKHSEKKDFTKERKQLIGLLKAHKSLSLKEMVEKTNMDIDTISQVITNGKEFTIDSITGRFKLK